MHKAQAHSDDAPDSRQRGQPYLGRCLLKDQITRHLTAVVSHESVTLKSMQYSPADIEKVEHRQPHIILMVINVDVRLEPNDFRISDVGTIEE